MLILRKVYVWIKKSWIYWLAAVAALILYLTGRANRGKIIDMFENKKKQVNKELEAVEKAKRKQERINDRLKEGLATLQKEKEKNDEKVTRDNRKKLKDASLKVKSKKEMIEYAKELAEDYELEYEE
tara:strand:- start:494 stop:874 length:381 start_codon:yes stop_codon:yes gene_type:complete